MQGNYYLFGSPISASPSPLLHNTGFTTKSLPFVYSLCDTGDINEVATVLKKEETLGGSVTIPHKQSVMPFLDSLSEDATRVKAVNTVKRVDGKLEGHNTDWWAIYSLTEKCLERAGRGKEGLTGLVVGAGGTAHAACYALQQLGIPFLIWNRTPEKAVELANQFGGKQVSDLDSIEKIDIVVSTVPPAVQFKLPEALVTPSLIVVELVYHPRFTSLLLQAREKGCITVEGSEILFVQGIRQFEIWTGETAPSKEMAHAFVHLHKDGLLKEDTPYTFRQILGEIQ
eukprot:TRINITY_DN7626_c0_g1_i1.p1 TRINITY_DN7626_c0_g1~~TRINITY_DN7626_c0_g1_i1.p1  ORF type:complete len:285 (+),score=64.65 TRINITY_DN7626_c0_g1_i1:90-944(+)